MIIAHIGARAKTHHPGSVRFSCPGFFSCYGRANEIHLQTKGDPEEGVMHFLHTMIRVNDLDESINFYCDVLGMKLLRKILTSPLSKIRTAIKSNWSI